MSTQPQSRPGEHRAAELESANRELAAAVRLAEDARAEVAAVEAEQRALTEAMRDVILGYSRDAARQMTEFASGTAYLEKPFSPQRLATRVRELLDMASVSHEENR